MGRPGSARSSTTTGSVTGQKIRGSMARGQYALQVHRAGGSSFSGMSQRSSRRMVTKLKMVRSLQQAQHITFMPEAHREEDNGWQMKCEDVKSRIGALFNCYTMSDVIFQVEVYNIPAHKFILASASPIFYKQLYEEGVDQSHSYGVMHMQRTGSFLSESGMSGMSGYETTSPRHVKLTIQDVPHLAFFEFLQFIYTDNVNITLDNVLMLLFLADHYKVAGLSDRCFDFIKSEVVPHAVLRVLNILRELLLKAIVSLWKDLVEQRKSLLRFRQLTLAERRAKMEEMNDASSIGSTLSRRDSVCSRRSARSRTSMISDRSSIPGRRSMYGSKSDRMYRDSSDEDFDTIEDDDSDVPDMAMGFGKKKKMTWDTGFKGSMMNIKIAGFVEELHQRCWKCIIEDTAAVIASNHMWDQDVMLLRKILRLETCSVPEISLFRCANDWAERTCAKEGISVNAQTKREILGQETLYLIRFPCMTLDQFQWEVVPTGLLPYEDVQSLLTTMTQRTPALHQYNSKPRSNVTLRANMRSLSPDSEEKGKPIYTAVEGDHLDTMLGAELLRAFLKEGTHDQDIMRPGTQDGKQASPNSKGRLPPISSPRATPRSAMEYVFTAGGTVKPPGSRRARKSAAEMVMGSRLDEVEAEDGAVMQGGGRKPQPHDFVRLCHGLYQFREEHVVELFDHTGEAMVVDHGFNACLSQYHWNDADLDAKTVRTRLRLPERDTYGYARGVPLTAFLCRQ
mmetsp:Transcript_127159/g.231032  ORF Transcript_127159/g.231032 Transcript_127159/m.231032 type:complete len:736 (+) Transcript_127159:1-2208(+)